jgi:hypothetical protein
MLSTTAAGQTEVAQAAISRRSLYRLSPLRRDRAKARFKSRRIASERPGLSSMSQATRRNTTIPTFPARRRNRTAAKPAAAAKAAPQFIHFGMPWSDEEWVASFVPGPTDMMVVMLHHDAPELERVVAGLLASREAAKARLAAR